MTKPISPLEGLEMCFLLLAGFLWLVYSFGVKRTGRRRLIFAWGIVQLIIAALLALQWLLGGVRP